jgi:hypothetical protein
LSILDSIHGAQYDQQDCEAAANAIIAASVQCRQPTMSPQSTNISKMPKYVACSIQEPANAILMVLGVCFWKAWDFFLTTRNSAIFSVPVSIRSVHPHGEHPASRIGPHVDVPDASSTLIGAWAIPALTWAFTARVNGIAAKIKMRSSRGVDYFLRKDMFSEKDIHLQPTIVFISNSNATDDRIFLYDIAGLDVGTSFGFLAVGQASRKNLPSIPLYLLHLCQRQIPRLKEFSDSEGRPGSNHDVSRVPACVWSILNVVNQDIACLHMTKICDRAKHV